MINEKKKKKRYKNTYKAEKLHKAAKKKTKRVVRKKSKKLLLMGTLWCPVNTTQKLLVFSRRVLERNAWDKPYAWPYVERNQFYVPSTYAQEKINFKFWKFSKFNHNYGS